MAPRDCYDVPPTEPGVYNVVIPGIKTLLPIFWKWDGKQWETNTLPGGLTGPGQAYWYEK